MKIYSTEKEKEKAANNGDRGTLEKQAFEDGANWAELEMRKNLLNMIDPMYDYANLEGYGNCLDEIRGKIA